MFCRSFFSLLVSAAFFSQTALSLPDFSRYKNHITFTQFLSDGSTGSFDFHWRIDDQNQNNASLSMALHLYPVPKPNETHNAWMGIGFGKAMFEATYIIMHSNISIPYIHEHQSDERYSHLPKKVPLDQYVTKLYKSEINEEGFYAEFNRLLAGGPNKELQPEILLSEPQDLLWAYNPSSTIDFMGVFFQPHGPNSDNRLTHGLLQIDWNTGFSTVKRVSDISVRNIHGIGMLIIWLLVFPGGAYTARFLRFVPGWIIIHVTLQGLGILGFAIMVVLGIINVRIWNRPHYILGLIITGLVLVQAILGVSNRVKLSNSETGSVRNFIRLTHKLNALVLLLASAIQGFIGLNTVYPIEDPDNRKIWIAPFIVFSIVVLTFVCSELYFGLRFRFPDRFTAKKLDAKGAKGAKAAKDTSRSSADEESHRVSLVGKKEVKPGPGSELLMKNAAEKEEAELKQFTWEAFDEAIKEGKIYVIGNGRFVYDASQWITSHPGGQQILHSVAGTDISNDFFDELGTELANSRSSLLSNPRASLLPSPKATPSAAPEAVLSPMPDFGNFTENDWKFVLNSRRAHKHSVLAIQRLSSLLIGVVPSTENHNEYKRYTLTEKDGNKLRFAELYPMQEVEIKEEQCVEFSVRIKGKWYEQTYTPVGGSMTCFEVVVDDGTVGTFLKELRIGGKQVKVRGPVAKEAPVLASVDDK